MSWPQSPAAPPSEQLDVFSEQDARYLAWRDTLDGERVYAEIRRRAIDALHRGEKRLGVKSVCERIRDDWHVEINNSYTGLIARELVMENPSLKQVIHLRRRP